MSYNISDVRSVARLLAVMGNELYRSNLVGKPCPSVKERLERMVAPKAGDLVMETSSGAWVFGTHNYRTKPESAVGILRSIAKEIVPYDEPWDEVAEGRPQPKEQVWYVAPLDGNPEIRWTNADFITIIPSEGWGAIAKNPCLWDTLRDIVDPLPTKEPTK